MITTSRYEQALKQREEARARLAPTIARMEAEGRLPKLLSKEQIEMYAKLEEECGGILCGSPEDFMNENDFSPEEADKAWKRATSTECAIPFTPLADMPDKDTTNFYEKLSSQQKELGEDFSRVLYSNLWNLYDNEEEN